MAPSFTWPIRAPRPIDLPAAKPLVSRLVRRGRTSESHYLEAAKQLLRLSPAPGGFRADIQHFLDLALTVDKYKQEAVGARAPNQSMNGLIEYLAGLISADHYPSCEEFNRLVTLQTELEHTTDFVEVFLWGNVSMVTVILSDKLKFHGWVTESLSAPTEVVDSSVIGALAELNDDLASELSFFRRYGVKTAFFQDNFFHHSSEAWVVTDPVELARGGFGINEGLTPGLAHFWLAGCADLANARITFEEHNRGEWVSRKYNLGFEARVSLTLDAGGQLAFRKLTSIVSPQAVMEAAGQGSVYEVMRLVNLIRLYDLVVPTETVANMPRFSAGIQGRFGKIGQPALHPDLIIPRILALQNRNGLMKDLERELELAESETRARSLQSRHEVINHIRRLPDGRHPTPDARQRARDELGIELSDNETYVKKHERGDGQKRPIHKAKRRK